MSGRKPDYWLKALNKSTAEKRKVGAGWKNPNGSISIDLDAFTLLDSSPDLVTYLYLRIAQKRMRYDLSVHGMQANGRD